MSVANLATLLSTVSNGAMLGLRMQRLVCLLTALRVEAVLKAN